MLLSLLIARHIRSAAAPNLHHARQVSHHLPASGHSQSGAAPASVRHPYWNATTQKAWQAHRLACTVTMMQPGRNPAVRRC